MFLSSGRYNLGRVFESLCQHDKAERLYKDIIKECPNYIDCFLRLGCMLRDRGQVLSRTKYGGKKPKVSKNL